MNLIKLALNDADQLALKYLDRLDSLNDLDLPKFEDAIDHILDSDEAMIVLKKLFDLGLTNLQVTTAGHREFITKILNSTPLTAAGRAMVTKH